VILNLGCGDNPITGADEPVINVDYRETPIVDTILDITRMPWPFDDGQFSSIYALDVIEHVHDVLGLINECWRVTKPEGNLYIQTVHWRSVDAYTDITHHHAFSEHSMNYFDPRTMHGQKYGYYTDRKWHIQDVGRRDGQLFFQLQKQTEGA
jgi:SAM-dependent methyltransferase